MYPLTPKRRALLAVWTLVGGKESMVYRPTPMELALAIVLALVGIALIIAILTTDWLRAPRAYVAFFGYWTVLLSFLLVVAWRRNRR